MNIFVKAKPNARVNKLIELSPNTFEIHVTAPPVDGKANSALIEMLAIHFQLPKSQIKLKNGQTSRTKLFQIP
ncbi:MAG: DUF167 domain-containing protein [Patescibacteria group bacterium]